MKSAGGPSSWSLASEVDDAGVTGQFASLSVSGDSGQNLAIAYYEDWEYRLKVARSDGRGRSLDDGGRRRGWSGAVGVDHVHGYRRRTDEPTYAVSCYDSLADDLRYAAWDGTDWMVR